MNPDYAPLLAAADWKLLEGCPVCEGCCAAPAVIVQRYAVGSWRPLCRACRGSPSGVFVAADLDAARQFVADTRISLDLIRQGMEKLTARYGGWRWVCDSDLFERVSRIRVRLLAPDCRSDPQPLGESRWRTGWALMPHAIIAEWPIRKRASKWYRADVEAGQHLAARLNRLGSQWSVLFNPKEEA